MNLSKLLEDVPVMKMFQTMYGRMVVTQEVDVQGIRYDSRKVRKGEMFVAIQGLAADGHAFIQDAIRNGASVVVLQDDASIPDSYFMHAGVVKIVVQNSRRALATISANFYNHPSRHLKLLGVTGTNGKTTTTHLIKSILEENGETVGLIGTIGYKIGDEIVPATHTTPESLELNQLLSHMVLAGCQSAVMEVSSHALALDRVYGLRFTAGVFTNLTQDHLDFHESMEEYLQAKKRLFDSLAADAVAVTNRDDASSSSIVAGTKARMITYGMSENSSVTASDVRVTLGGTTLDVFHDATRKTVRSSLIGKFNVQNILGAYAVGVALAVEDAVISRGIEKVGSVPGRFEQIHSPAGWTAVVDYAHTPDALENCLRTIHEIPERTGKIITVFGCGGNRDKSKRPLMGNIASELSDVAIVTSDNPRFEDAQSIIDDIMAGIKTGAVVRTEIDRRAAIRQALTQARHGDIVLIAGKGHEDYQIVAGKQTHFDDREEVQAFIRNPS